MKFLKNYLTKKLQKQTKKFLAHHPQLKIIAVAGSVGKTSTRNAIATVLSTRFKVLNNPENHNTELSVPLTIMAIPFPEKLKSIGSWLKVLHLARKRTKKPFPFDFVVIELSTDHPGDIADFGTYLQPDLTIVTAVSAEHMEYFGTIEAIAQEELGVGAFSKIVAINRDDVEGKFAQYLNTSSIDTYGTSGIAEYHFLPEEVTAEGFYKGKLVTPEFGEQPVSLHVLGEHSVKAVVAGAMVGAKFGLSPEDVIKGVESVRPVAGRMQPLKGLMNSLIIDDSYNSSPLAAKAALQTLYAFPNQHRIAVLGSMNEFGPYSKAAHEEVGKACDPALLDWVITIGEDAETFLAPVAASKGCQVRSFRSALDAGAFAHSVLYPDSVVLVKGSQNGVFAEEAIKILLHSTDDEKKLVRQSPAWMQRKQATFAKFK